MANPHGDLEQANHDLQGHMEDHLKDEVNAEEFLDQVEEHEQKVVFLTLKVAIHEGEYQGPNGRRKLAKELDRMQESKQIDQDQRQMLLDFWQKESAS